jgi:hypothetical protein
MFPSLFTISIEYFTNHIFEFVKKMVFEKIPEIKHWHSIVRSQGSSLIEDEVKDANFTNG